MRAKFLVCSVTVAVLCLKASSPLAAQAPQEFAVIKAQVVWRREVLPPPGRIKLPINAAFILNNNPTANKEDGTILNESLLIHPKSKGIKNVVVWLLPGNPNDPLPPLLPWARRQKQPVGLELHVGTFQPRAVAMRQGQSLIVFNKNDPIDYRVRMIGDSSNNLGFSKCKLSAGGWLKVDKLKAQRLPLLMEDEIHSWMKGYVFVFNHPYFAVTDENGRFEIPYAPIGDFRIMIYHEEFGYRVGKTGEPITIKSGVNDLGAKSFSK